jgi:hypothetical protein
VCVSLQGTFDTLPVTELFGLLASAAKTGALRLDAGDREASVFLTGGLCCAVESDAAVVSAAVVASDTELAARLVDVGFAFARVATGSFRFTDSELAEHDTGVTTPLEPAVAEIRSLLEQWYEIEATIPSLDVRVRLARELRDDEVVVTAREWSLLVALEGTPTVHELVARRSQPMIEVCRDLKGLVDRGAVEIGVDLVPEITAVPEVAAVPEVPSPAEVDGSAGSSSEVPSEVPAGRRRDRRDRSGGSALEPAEPYAPEAHTPDSDDFVTAEAAAEAAADADAVAAGIVSRMARSRLSVPDVFPSDDDADEAGAALAEIAAAAADRGGAATSAEEAAPDRGALLRLFSALKES